PLAFQFCVCRQVGFFERCFSDINSLALEIQVIASIDFWVSARLGRLAQSAMSDFQNHELFRFSTFWFLFVNQS
ncbi:hypothetical protein ABMY12_23820, partial [Vibrio vulnificus]|uniref:hypothetical protein n=1 Tax=Vibrio vulnificus TaxID=672 RepID=UPI004058149D